MPDASSFADIDGQHGELLPARTVLSLFSAGARNSSDNGNIFDWFTKMLGQTNSAGNGAGGAAGSADAGGGGVHSS